MFADRMYIPKHIHNSVLQPHEMSIPIHSRASLNQNFAGPNVTHPGYTKISYNLTLTG